MNTTIPRDPRATRAAIDRALAAHEDAARQALDDAARPGGPQPYALLFALPELSSSLLCRYARGDALLDLERWFMDSCMPAFGRMQALSGEASAQDRAIMCTDELGSYAMLFALVCFDRDGAWLGRLDTLFDTFQPAPLFEILARAFMPAFRRTQDDNGLVAWVPHEREIVSLLAEPSDAWAPGLAAYMARWPDRMASRDDRFALHVGLTVCAFDIDDAAFRDVPWYPRELVEHYRAHVRHGRDAARGTPPVPAANPAAGTERAPVRKKKRWPRGAGAAWTRWVELVCAEDAALAACARKALGRRKTMAPLFEAMEALAGAGVALQADIKDDDTMAQQVVALCAALTLTAPDLPAGPPHGPARISAMLSFLNGWLPGQGRRLAVIDDCDGGGGDVWQAVTFAAGAQAEFAELCEQLGIATIDETRWR